MLLTPGSYESLLPGVRRGKRRPSWKGPLEEVVPYSGRLWCADTRRQGLAVESNQDLEKTRRRWRGHGT